MLEDDENRIVTVVNNANRNLSVQIINKYVINVSETLNKEYKTYTLKINLKELQYIFTKLYFFSTEEFQNKKPSNAALIFVYKTILLYKFLGETQKSVSKRNRFFTIHR